MNTNTQPKRGRGRPVGGISLVNVTLAELMAKYSPDQILPVGRLFLEKGSAKLITQPKQPAEIIAPIVDNGPRVEMTLQA